MFNENVEFCDAFDRFNLNVSLSSLTIFSSLISLNLSEGVLESFEIYSGGNHNVFLLVAMVVIVLLVSAFYINVYK